MENKDIFNYTYSAKEQNEIKKIRERYLSPKKKEIDKMEQLRRLDASVTRKSTAAALIVGIIGALILGTGMSLIMTELGKFLGAFSMPFGIVLGVIGMIFVALAYPLYNSITQKERERIAPEILQLTDELLK